MSDTWREVEQSVTGNAGGSLTSPGRVNLADTDSIKFPSQWEGWKIAEQIGTGSFGTVYMAENGEERCAVKVIAIPRDDSERAALLVESKNEAAAHQYLVDLVRNYSKEIRAMYVLQENPHIVKIEDHMIEELSPLQFRILIRMELLTPLRDYFTQMSMSEDEAIQIGLDMCDALIACDEHKIIHRDIKPDNIFRSSDGVYKLGDFGTARRLDMTFGTFSTKGTFSYMAPEVYRQDRYDRRVDIYSLGLVLYRFMNRNRDPFIDPEKRLIYYQDREEALRKRMDGEVIPPPIDASSDFSYVIRKACAYQPSKRFNSASDMKLTLEQLKAAKQSTESELFADTLDRTAFSRLKGPKHSDSGKRGLEGISGSYDGALIPLKPGESLTLGRDIQHCNLVLDGADISRIHCTVSLDSKGRYYYVKDHSRNGTWLNGSDRLVKEAAFRCAPGAEISLGNGQNRFFLV